MPSPQEIHNKITSVKKTQKITSAMQMVAASKMRKAQERMEISMPYADKIFEVMGHVANSHSEYKHNYLQPREEVNAVGYVVIGTDRGLCGGLNINLFRLLMQEFKTWQEKAVTVKLCLFGGKAVSYFKHIDAEILAQASGFGDHHHVSDLIGGVRTMLNAYDEHKIDRLFIVHNRFVNRMVQKPHFLQLLPFKLSTEEKRGYWDYIYEPDPKKLLDTLVVRYIESQVYQSIVDNLACEQAARMVAMKNATENAEKCLGELKLIYNKMRQAMITREIAEIISGAESV